MHNFRINNCDTDSISFNKKDNTEFSEQERLALLKQMNEISPEKILWEDDGYYRCVIILKAKNYILDNGKKVAYKGSALKSSKTEAALKEMQKAIIQVMLDGKDNYTEVYHRYILEALNIKDIKRWAGKKTLTDKIMTGERTNETKVLEALTGSDYKEGDKFYTYFKEDNSLGLVENFDGKYNKDKMLEKCYKSVQVFENVLECKALFLNYKLKKNRIALIHLDEDN